MRAVGHLLVSVTLNIETWPHDTALDLARAHRTLNPTHTLIVSFCDKCQQPLGLICCRDFVCAIESSCED